MNFLSSKPYFIFQTASDVSANTQTLTLDIPKAKITTTMAKDFTCSAKVNNNFVVTTFHPRRGSSERCLRLPVRSRFCSPELSFARLESTRRIMAGNSQPHQSLRMQQGRKLPPRWRPSTACTPWKLTSSRRLRLLATTPPT